MWHIFRAMTGRSRPVYALKRVGGRCEPTRGQAEGRLRVLLIKVDGFPSKRVEPRGNPRPFVRGADYFCVEADNYG